MTAPTTTRPELLESLRHSRSLAIDAGKTIERCRYAYQQAGNLSAAAELGMVAQRLVIVVNTLSELLNAESDRVRGEQ